ncbi:MAG: 5'/3'-nucleotidase SurE [Deltaproteobacteria bacterium]|nr:5'/3'-nucleotidase SurE [Deltaproteobacteria bacterium]
MNILVTNDDGIASPGIWQLAEAMTRLGNTVIVAPEKEQSAMGTSVTLRSTTKISEVPSSIPGVKAYAVSGTPSDCVLVGLRYMREMRIDLLVSGINYGPNCGRDIPHSGTVMATLPGYFRKIPSIAVSLAISDVLENARFDVAACVAKTVAVGIQEGKLPSDGIFNINVPNMTLDKIKGILVTKTAPTGYVQMSGRKSDGRYIFRVSKSITPEMLEGTDIWALESGYVSVTPLHIDVTHHDLIPRLQDGMGMVEAKLMAGQSLCVDKEDRL